MRFFCSASEVLRVLSSVVTVDSWVSRVLRVLWVEASSARIWVRSAVGVMSGGKGDVLALEVLGRSVLESVGEGVGGKVGGWACFQAAAARSASLVTVYGQP